MTNATVSSNIKSIKIDEFIFYKFFRCTISKIIYYFLYSTPVCSPSIWVYSFGITVYSILVDDVQAKKNMIKSCCRLSLSYKLKN